MFALSLVSFLCGIISINFSKQNYTTIESQAAQNDKLQQDILHDQMTGLYNHNTFITQLDKHIDAFSGNTPFCIAMLDVDNFKHINDTYGHDCGDIVLTQLAKIIKKHCPANASAYRYGGEEFAVLFPEHSPEEALAVLERILAEFRQHSFRFTDQAITFSSGIAEYSPGTSRDTFFELADKTLYKAKKAGKNRVLLA